MTVRRFRHRFRPILASAALAACGPGGRSEPAAVVRDSGGVTIVENRGPAWSEVERWRVAPAPVVDIGVIEGAPEYQLFRVTDALRLSDGLIVVANAGTGELRYYDAGGRHLFSAGRQGGGPGEFEQLSWIEPTTGDSVLAYDGRLRRLSTFDSAGRFAGSRTIQSATATGPLVLVGRFRDGSYLLQAGVGVDPRSLRNGLTRIPSTLCRWAAADAPLESLGQFPGMDGVIRASGSSIQILLPPYSRSLVAAAHGEYYYVGPQDEYEVEVRSTAGGPGRRIRWSGRDLTATPELVERYRAERLAGAGTEEQRSAIEQTLANMEFPETLPAYGDIRVDAAGNLWVEELRRPGEEGNRWHVFDPDGRLLGPVDLPAGLEVFQIGPNFVLGRWRDELDVEHVRLHALERPPAMTASASARPGAASASAGPGAAPEPPMAAYAP